MKYLLVGIGVLLFLALIAFLNMAIPQMVQSFLAGLPL